MGNRSSRQDVFASKASHGLPVYSKRAGQELLLRTSTGPAYRFAFVDLVRVPPQASEIFRQIQPGLTLALLDEPEQDTRIVARAVYLPQSELSQSVLETSSPVKLGQPTVLDDALRVTALDHRPVLLGNEAPGFIHLAVAYRLENLSGQPLPTGNFAAQVSDGHQHLLVNPMLEPDRRVIAEQFYMVHGRDVPAAAGIGAMDLDDVAEDARIVRTVHEGS